MQKLLPVALLAALSLLPACSDDPAEPEPFAVSVKVVDTAGDPVPGLKMNVTSNNDFLQDHIGKAAVAIPMTIIAETRVCVTIEDVAGRVVRNLVDQQLPAGQHRIVWNGRDDTDVHLHSGYYVARLVVHELGTDAVIWQGTAPMLMALLDSDHSPVGVTDDRGKIVLRDMTLFPHLYDLPPFSARNENGEIMGQLELNEEMIFTFGDTITHTRMYVVTEISGSDRLEFLWAPRPAPAPPKAQTTMPVRIVPAAEPDYGIGPVYPNPFN
ncbi:MAG: hypothetical protein GY838_10830 [bacterium]|nr:hypothetical protein [bacterium]